jgi:hypothetical protein
MQVFSTVVAAVSVAAIFCIWRGYADILLRRRRALRERVAYMLWVAAEEADTSAVVAGGRRI